MKKLFCFLCCLVSLAMLCAGCSPSASQASSNVSSSSSNTSSDSSASNALPNKPSDQNKQTIELPDYTRTPIRDYYICAANYDSTYCPDTVFPRLRLTILSVDELDPESISVNIDCSSTYTSFVAEVFPEDCVFNYYLYCCYAGLDWEKALRLYQSEDEAERAEFDEYINLYSAEYSAALEQGLPTWQYHVYDVFIHFSSFCDETISTLNISWPGTSETVSLGEVRLSSSSYADGLTYAAGIAVNQTIVGMSGYPDSNMYGFEVISAGPLAEFETLVDLKLLSCKFAEGYDNSTEIEEIQVVLTNLNNASDVTDFIWDGTSPIYVDEGYQVACYFKLSNPMFAQPLCDGQVVLIVECEYDGDIYHCPFSIGLDNKMGQYNALLAIYLDGIDVEAYYEDFYIHTLE